MHFCLICVNNKSLRIFALSHSGLVGPGDLLSICIDQACSYLFSNMGRHNFHPYLHISLQLNRVILHSSSSGVAGVVNHRYGLLLSTSSLSSPSQRTGLSSTPPWPHSVIYVIKSTLGLSSNPCKSEHLRAADLPLRQNYAHVGTGNVKDGGTFTLLHFSSMPNCVDAVFLLKRCYVFCYICVVLPILEVENESWTFCNDKMLRLSCRS